MASTMNSGDASFTLANAFEMSDVVQIDGRGKGTVLKKISSTAGDLYQVMLDGTEFTITVRGERLTHFMHLETESETENRPIPKQTNKRFVDVQSEDISDFVDQQRNKNTLSKTFYDLKLLTSFLHQESINEHRPIYEIPPNELCTLLCRFFLSVRKADGSNYEPNTLHGLKSSYERHLRNHNYEYSLSKSVEFNRLRDVLKSKQRELKRQGLGNLKNRADAVTDEDIEKLWQSNQMGAATPESIINTLWFYSTIHFGTRTAEEHRNMCWADISLKVDGEGEEYLEFVERQTKTRTGENPKDVRKVTPKMWSNPENISRCPVEVYKQYSLLRPSDFCKPEDPLYLATHTIQGSMKPTDQWFKRQPIGVNKISTIMKRMSINAGLPPNKKLTNHSARKHLVQKLSDNNVPPTEIMQITGHKNVHSVNNYSSLSENKHKNISRITSNATTYQQMPNPYGQNSLCLNQFNSMAQHNQNLNNTATRTVQGGLNSMFSGNIFGGTFNINVINEKPSSPQKKRRRIIYDSDSD